VDTEQGYTGVYNTLRGVLQKSARYNSLSSYRHVAYILSAGLKWNKIILAAKTTPEI